MEAFLLDAGLTIFIVKEHTMKPSNAADIVEGCPVLAKMAAT